MKQPPLDSVSTGSDHTLLDRTFRVSLLLKGLNGVLELVGGLALLLVGPGQLHAIATALTHRELMEDPGDFLANTLVRLASRLDLSAQLFAAIYLLVHGVVKVVLVLAVLRDRLWAYPWLIATLIAFIGYQTFELFRSFGWGLLLLTAFDIFIVVLTFREYGLHKQRVEVPDTGPDPSP
ncbi:DUF2127 domain-containing protein [Aestuariimicrobium sp. T2.26MG-19.2B]|uniref:DUF2127 domain-containing protein n=1 Tax=Aestuariimicrobium sp. T2.26MG-19.2B TaxID=3040679 RepID=UPI002477A1FC|nr:DUF2127 domain-containing protein [Aestuariimicrobium sp. T2.26MG-19.2B]CAI9411425.1 hypothetical protein AESSP_02647 [Aestuariimicrobium sp. T2.26MG-19.2B]